MENLTEESVCLDEPGANPDTINVAPVNKRGAYEAHEWSKKKAEFIKEGMMAAYLDPCGALIVDVEGSWVDQIRCALQEAYLAGVAATPHSGE